MSGLYLHIQKGCVNSPTLAQLLSLLGKRFYMSYVLSGISVFICLIVISEDLTFKKVEKLSCVFNESENN